MNQMNQEQMNQYYMQMRKMRMMQEYNSQARYSNPNAGWPRNYITNMPPNLQQMSPQPRMNSMMHSIGYNTNTNSALRMQNLPNQQYQQAGAYRKMPILEEAPAALRGQSPISQHQQQVQGNSYNPQYNVNQNHQQTSMNLINSTKSNPSKLQPSISTDNSNLHNINFMQKQNQH